MWWFGVLALASGPTWVQTLTDGVGQDGRWLTADELRPRLKAHCDAGVAGACAWLEARHLVQRPTLAEVAAVLQPACDGGEAASCLPSGWQLGQARHGVYTPRAVDDAAPAMHGWMDELEDCVVGSGYVVPKVRLNLKIHRRGSPVAVELPRGSGVESIDQCIVDTLLMARGPDLLGSLKVSMEVDLMQLAELDEPPPQRYRSEPIPHEGEPHVERVLVLVVARHGTTDKSAALGARSVASIEEAHEEAYEWIASHTGGALRVEHEVVVVDAPLLRALGEGDAANRWSLQLGDLSPEVLAEIEPGAYDTVYIWAPLPRGAPQPSLGTVWNHRLLRGASVVTMGLPSGREFLLLGGHKSFLAILTGHYRVWRDRADYLLGVSLPPSDRVLRRDDGKRFDPQLTGDEPLDFYRFVFANHFRPELWGDLTAVGEAYNEPTAGNLAYRAEAIASEGVDYVDYLNDGVVQKGDLWVSAYDDGDHPSSWFGLSWAEPVELGRVRAVLPRASEERPPTLTVEAWLDDRWVAIEQVSQAREAVDIAFEPVSTTGIRLVVDSAEERRCLELEAFAP
jgi:hypothetical protein